MHLSNEVNPLIPLTVGKAVIAIAWADGRIQPEEIECIHNMLKEAPDIPGSKLELLNDLLLRPIQPTEREVIIDELAGLLHNREERNFAIYWLNKMVTSKGTPVPHEQEIHDALVKRLMGDSGTSAPPFSRVVKETSGHLTPTLDHMMQVWMGIVREHVPDLKLNHKQLREIIMVGLILSRVILADCRIDEEEVEEIVKFFIKHWKLDKNPASSLAKLLLAQEIEQDKDIILLSEELRDSAPKKDLVAYADVLFRVSAVTGGLCDQEINEIICISASLGMDHHYFARNLKQFAEGLH